MIETISISISSLWTYWCSLFSYSVSKTSTSSHVNRNLYHMIKNKCTYYIHFFFLFSITFFKYRLFQYYSLYVKLDDRSPEADHSKSDDFKILKYDNLLRIYWIELEDLSVILFELAVSSHSYQSVLNECCRKFEVND